MEHITVIITTRNRMERLKGCLASIPKAPWVSVIVGCDADYKTAQALCSETEYPNIVLYSQKHVGSLRLANLLASMAPDGLFLLCDDMEILPGSMEKALEKFNQEFPDDDGCWVSTR